VIRKETTIFLLAVQFLTRLPMPKTLAYTPERFAATVRYYPLVGAVIGGFAASVFWLSHLMFPLTVSIVVSTVLTVLFTGAFHEDGLADSFDGIGGGITRERVLEIMKDSRIGVYGAAALMAALALKITVLMTLSPQIIIAVLIGGHCLSRLSSLIVIATSHYVRDHGTAKPVAGGIGAGALLFAGVTSAIVLLALAGLMAPLTVLFAVIGCAIGHVMIRSLFEKKLGGYTGDTLGAVQQVSEVGFYLGAAAWL